MTSNPLAYALPDGVVVADGAGSVLLVSDVAAAMLGVDAVASVGRPLGEVLRLQNHDGSDWVSCNQPYAGLPSRTGVPEQSWLTADGAEVLVTARLSRREPRGLVSQVAVAIRSGRGRSRLDRERSDLVATVAHELRSPLTGVKGFVQVLLSRGDKLTDEQKTLMLTTVASDADRLSRLIAELLDVARLDTGRLELYPRPASAQVLVERIVASVQASTARPIVLDADDDLPDVFIDPDKFTQVITNLVENAVRHGDGTVSVGLSREEASEVPDGVRVTVSDEGEGIRPELRRRVFTKFWTDGSRGGSGLGLYLAHGLVRAHAGTITIDDAPGGGARLAVTWPGVPPELC